MPAASGITTLSAASPVIAYWFRMLLAVCAVGKMLGFQIVKIRISTIHTYTAPMLRKLSRAASRTVRRLAGASAISALVIIPTSLSPAAYQANAW